MWWNIKIAVDQDREKQPRNILFGQRKMYTDAVIYCNILRASEHQQAEHFSQRSKTHLS